MTIPYTTVVHFLVPYCRLLHDYFLPHASSSWSTPCGQSRRRVNGTNTSTLCLLRDNFGLHMTQVVEGKAQSHTGGRHATIRQRTDRATLGAHHIGGIQDATNFGPTFQARQGYIIIPGHGRPGFGGTPERTRDARCNFNAEWRRDGSRMVVIVVTMMILFMMRSLLLGGRLMRIIEQPLLMLPVLMLMLILLGISSSTIVLARCFLLIPLTGRSKRQPGRCGRCGCSSRSW